MIGQAWICHPALPQDMALERQVTGMAAGLRKAGSSSHYTLSVLAVHL